MQQTKKNKEQGNIINCVKYKMSGKKKYYVLGQDDDRIIGG